MMDESVIAYIKSLKKMPKLRFSEFYEVWIQTKVENLAIVTSGGTPNRQISKYWNGTIPWITTSLINFNRITNAEEFITEEGLKNSSAKLFPKGTIIIALYGQGVTRGKIAILNIAAATNQACAAILVKENQMNKDFLFYDLQRRYNKIRNISNDGSQKNLSGALLKSLVLFCPSLPEQKKIASFLSAVDDKIRQLSRKKELLEQYKKGVIQKIFTQEIRFKTEDGIEYPEWEKRKLSDILFEHGLKSTGKEEVYSVSVHKGLINQIEHLGRSFAAQSTGHYNLVKPNDIVYTKSPTGDFPLGIIKQSKIDKNVIVSPLYGVFTPETSWLGYMLNVYFESPINTHNYLASIIQKGAKNTINITNSNFLSKKLLLPISMAEQERIGKFLKTLDHRISQVNDQVEKTKQFKKGLLQQMFV